MVAAEHRWEKGEGEADGILDVAKSSEQSRKTLGKDLSANKLTNPKMIGIAKSMEFAQNFNMQATEQLTRFDPKKAAPLLAMEDFVQWQK